MDWSLLFGFAAMAAVIEISPGPNFLLITRSVAAFGISGAIANSAGFSCSYTLHGALAIFGVSTVLAAEPILLIVIQFAGAGYLLLLGVKSFETCNQKTRKNATAAVIHPVDILLTPVTDHKNRSVITVSMRNRISLAFAGGGHESNAGIDIVLDEEFATTRNGDLFNCFRDGMLISAFNPKISLFYIAAFPQFIPAKTDAMASSFCLVFIHIVINVLWTLVVAIVLNYALKKAGSQTLVDKLNGFSGFAHIGLSVAFFTSAVRAC